MQLNTLISSNLLLRSVVPNECTSLDNKIGLRIKFIITKVEDIIDTLNSFSRFSRYSRVVRFSRLHLYIMTNDPTYEHLDIKHVLMDVKKYKLNLKLEHIINCSFVINGYTNTFTNTLFNLQKISCCRISKIIESRNIRFVMISLRASS